MVTKPDLDEQIKYFRGELAAAEAEAKRAITRVDSLRQIVSGLRGLSTAAEPEQTEKMFEDLPATQATAEVEPPRAVVAAEVPLTGRDAVRRVLIESRRAWKIPELAAEIQRRGWMPGVASPRDATAASVQRLWRQDKEVERLGHGVYRYRLDKLPPLAEEPVPTQSEGGEPG